MIRWNRSAAAILALAASVTLSGCELLMIPLAPFVPDQRLPSIEGEEDKSLLPRLHGTLVVPRDHLGRLDVWTLPAAAPHHVTLEGDVVDYSGPDENGRILYLTHRDGIFSERTQLRSWSLATRKDETLRVWDRLLGEQCRIELSPEGGRLALLAGPNVEVYAVPSGELLATLATISCNGVRWSREGDRLLVKARTSESKAPFHLDSTAENVFREVDVESIRSIVPDLAAALPSDWKKENGSHPPLAPGVSEDSLPGVFFRGLIAVLPERIAIYNALPTKGMPQRSIVYTHTWPTGYWTIKAVDLDTGRFCTVVSNVYSEAEYAPVDVQACIPPTPPAEIED